MKHVMHAFLSIWLVAFFAISNMQAQNPTGSTDGMWGIPNPQPVYQILPRVDSHGRIVPVQPVPVLQVRPSQPYAYGWFGAKPTPKWSRHIGTQGAYTQWTLK